MDVVNYWFVNNYLEFLEVLAFSGFYLSFFIVMHILLRSYQQRT